MFHSLLSFLNMENVSFHSLILIRNDTFIEYIQYNVENENVHVFSTLFSAINYFLRWANYSKRGKEERQREEEERAEWKR